MHCTPSAYKDRSEAISAKRRLMRTFRLTSTLVHCEVCDHFHVVAEMHRRALPPKWIEVVDCLAQGYRDHETAAIVGMSPRAVERCISHLVERLNALSRPHLVAICISLGIIDPNVFVPEEEERKHA